MTKRVAGLFALLIAASNLLAQSSSLDLRFGGHTLGEPTEVFFATAKKDGSSQLATDYCKSLLADATVKEKTQQRDDVMKDGGVFTLQKKDFGVLDVGNCQQVIAALKGQQAHVGSNLAPELGPGAALFAFGRLSALDLTSHSLYGDVVSDMERRFGSPGEKDTVSREGWPPVQEMRWERDGVGAAVWKAPFSDDVVALIGLLEPPYHSFVRGTPAPESSVFSPETCKAAITSDLKKVHIPPEQMAGLLYHRVPAVYPEAAKESRVEGVVSLDVIIDDCGNVVESSLISGPQQLVAAAITAVKQWKYRPLALWGQPKTAFESEQKVRFVLASDKTREAQELVEQARSKSDLRELPAFAMKATVKIENQGKLVEGQYTLLWNGPNQWREETSFPGFDEIRIGGAGTVALKRSLDFVPLRVFQLHRTLAYGRDDLTLRLDEGIKQVHTRWVNGIHARCAEITDKVNKREICADASTGALVRDHPFVDTEFVALGGKIFPHSLKYIEEGKTVAEAEITELKTTEPSPSPAFDVPAGAVSKPSCLNPTAGHLIKRVNPSYPESDRRARVQGTVAIYALIGVDGSLHDPRIVSSVSPGLNKASLEAVQQWRYEPFTCQDTPVEIESLGGHPKPANEGHLKTGQRE